MPTKLTEAKVWQRERAMMLHAAFLLVAKRVDEEGAPIGAELDAVRQRVSASLVQGRFIKASPATIRRAWDDWRHGGKTAEALLPERRGFECKVTPEFVMEFQRRCTMPGCANVSVAIAALKSDWAAGNYIEGLGDRFTWCHENGLPIDEIPEFPVSDKTLYRWQPGRAVRAGGARGDAEMRKASAYVDLDYSQLRKCELYTLDDVRLDVLCIDERTGKPTEVVCYIMMEVGSRLIPAFLLKPAAAIKQADVDELLAYALRCPGFGIGDGYVTHILFERGTVACSEAAQRLLEGATNDGIKVHRTGMDGGVRWIGAARDRASGHAAGKGVIESFNRRLHLALMHLAGQRGSDYTKQPANLGYNGPDNLSPDSLAARAQALAQFRIASGRRLRLTLPMLYLYELHAAVRAAIAKHNNEPGHDYSGHGSFTQAEVAPGVWKDTP